MNETEPLQNTKEVKKFHNTEVNQKQAGDKWTNMLLPKKTPTRDWQDHCPIVKNLIMKWKEKNHLSTAFKHMTRAEVPVYYSHSQGFNIHSRYEQVIIAFSQGTCFHKFHKLISVNLKVTGKVHHKIKFVWFFTYPYDV